MDVDEIFDTARINLISQSSSLANDQGAQRQPEPARLRGRQGCEQVANNGTGVVAVRGRTIQYPVTLRVLETEIRNAKSAGKLAAHQREVFIHG